MIPGVVGLPDAGLHVPSRVDMVTKSWKLWIGKSEVSLGNIVGGQAPVQEEVYRRKQMLAVQRQVEVGEHYGKREAREE